MVYFENIGPFDDTIGKMGPLDAIIGPLDNVLGN